MVPEIDLGPFIVKVQGAGPAAQPVLEPAAHP
jgi:hypothetical protein